MRVSGQGIDVALPPGWEARIYRRAPSAAPAGTAGHAGATTHAVLHAGNFPLPPERGDFGSSATAVMGPADVLVVLFEYAAPAAGTALFAVRGLPRRLEPTEFRTNQLQRPLPGQSGVQRFATESGRPFSLYVVLGAHARRASLVPLANALLGAVRIAPAGAR